jgi:hypothetical protein
MSESILTLCQSRLYPPSQRHWIWPQYEVATNGMWPLARWSSISLYRSTKFNTYLRTSQDLLQADSCMVPHQLGVPHISCTLCSCGLYHIPYTVPSTVDSSSYSRIAECPHIDYRSINAGGYLLYYQQYHSRIAVHQTQLTTYRQRVVSQKSSSQEWLSKRG